MVDKPYTTVANSAGKAVLAISEVPKGLLWIVQQVSIQTIPFRAGCTCSVAKNTSFAFSSSIGSSDTAFGPPAIILFPVDTLNVVWSGLTSGDEAIAVLWLEEQPWSENPSPTGVV